MNFKKIIISLSLIFVFISTVFFVYPDALRNTLKSIIPTEIRNKIKLLAFGEEFLDNMRYYHLINYNEKTLPETQFETLSLKRIKLDLLKTTTVSHYSTSRIQTGFLETFKDKIILTYSDGSIFIFDNSLSLSNPKNFKSNLKKKIKVVGSLVSDKILYLSLYEFSQDKTPCPKLRILSAKIFDNKFTLNFETLFSSNECNDAFTGGAITISKEKKLYFSTGSSDWKINSRQKAQDDNSINGKIIELDLGSKDYRIYSKGHRNPLGLLFVKGDILLSAEHGAFGGDEINKIVDGGNYGWPISSYGEYYDFHLSGKSKISNEYDKIKLKKSHIDHGFKEPIYSFVPSIGINSIIEIPEKFSENWQNNFFVTSLNRRSLYRTKFDKNYNKVLFFEEIRVGERIRDIIFMDEENLFVLYLEDQSLLILKN